MQCLLLLSPLQEWRAICQPTNDSLGPQRMGTLLACSKLLQKEQTSMPLIQITINIDLHFTMPHSKSRMYCMSHQP